jgi:hypothetical protein
MSQQAFPTPSLAAAPVMVLSDKFREEGFEAGRCSFIDAPRQPKMQFAPHRLVASYSEYRRLGASKVFLFG